MQQQSSLIYADKSQRQRSSSKKKGISVSLTPSKNQSTHEFDVSRVSTNKIGQLPIVGYQSSTDHGFNSGRKTNRINFSYQSPAGSQVCQSKSKREQNFIHSQIAIESVLKNQQKPSSNQVNKALFSPSSMFSNVEIKTQQLLKQNVQKGQQIRPNIFNIVQQIASKVYTTTKNKNQQQNNVKQTSPSHKNSLKNNQLLENVQTKVTKKKQVSKQKQQTKLEMIAQCTLQTSDQLIRVNQYQIENEKALRQKEFSFNRNYQNLMKQQQRKRIQRFKKAQQKLLKIIKVCDYGL